MAERIARGIGKGGGASRPQIRKVPRTIVFTKAKQAAFLAELARTCNVAASARSVGVLEKTVSSVRRRNADFQAAWNAALAEGYVNLELKLLEEALACHAEDGDGSGETPKRGPFDPKLALALLKAHRDTVMAERARAGSGGAGSITDEMARELDEKLDPMARRLMAEEDTTHGGD